jgi:hypothetical protein
MHVSPEWVANALGVGSEADQGQAAIRSVSDQTGERNSVRLAGLVNEWAEVDGGSEADTDFWQRFRSWAVERLRFEGN